jgi:hypothetical protein
VSLLNWLGLIWLLVVPALILLYMFRPVRLRMPVPSLRLWQALPQIDRTRTRIRRPPLSLLLLLQAAALAIGAFALAQPAFTAPAGRNSVVILDTSGSMQALDNGKSRFDAAIAEAHKIVDTMGEHDRLTLLGAGTNITTACAACTRADASTALDAFAPGAGSADIAGALAVVSGLSTQTSGPLDVVVLSDGQFSAPDTRGIPFSLKYVQVGAPINDVAVAALSARRPPDGRTGYIAYARIENRGRAEVDIQVSAQADNVPLPTRSQTVPEEGHVGITWQVPAGTLRFTVSVSPSDSLPADDHAVVFLPAAGRYTVGVAAPQPELYVRALSSIDGLNIVTNTSPAGAAFNILGGTLPNPLPDGNLLLINPNGDLLKPGGTVGDLRPTTIDAAHPLLAGVDLNALLVNVAGNYEPPDWLETLVASPSAPLLLAGEREGRRIVVLTFDPHQSNLPKLAAFPLLMANVVDWLYPLSSIQAVDAGQPVQLPSGSTVQTPSGRSLPVTAPGLFITTDQGGIYRVIGPGGSPDFQFAVNTADAPDTPNIPSHPELDHPVQEEAVTQVTSQLFWLPLAAVALALFGAEWLIYCWKRGST